MSKTSAHSTYARLVGEISISWNEIERRMDALIYHYLALDLPVAGFILGELGNATKAELGRFLINLYEPNAILKEHGLHSISLINRLRENRNILEHARPYTWQDQYDGIVFKTNKRGNIVVFGAPVSKLKDLARTMHIAAPYIRWLTYCLCMSSDEPFEGFSGGPQTANAALQVLASIERPQLPDKIDPLEPLGGPTGG